MQNEIAVDNDWWAEGPSAGKGRSGRRPDLIRWAPASGCWTSPAAVPGWCCPECRSASSLPVAAAAPWTRGRVGYLDHPLQSAACLPTIKQTGTCKTTACTLQHRGNHCSITAFMDSPQHQAMYLLGPSDDGCNVRPPARVNTKMITCVMTKCFIYSTAYCAQYETSTIKCYFLLTCQKE